MSTYLNRIRRAWSDHVVGPTLQTYDAACEQLGGAPWRPLPEKTDTWFLNKPESANGSVKLPALDTGAMMLKRPMSDRTKMALVGGGAIVVIALCLVALSGGSRAVAASSPLTSPITSPLTSPLTSPITSTSTSTSVKVKVAQAVGDHRASPSVRALFGPASTAGARPHAVAKRHTTKHHRR
jgi:hypothetical protein